MLLQQTEPLLTWQDPLKELLGFAALFLSSGAVGFRYSALRERLGVRRAASATDDAHESAARRAAAYGLLGALLGLYPLSGKLSGAAARAHVPIGQLVTIDLGSGAMVVCAALAIIGFLLASRGLRAGWLAALVGVVFGALPALFSGQWSRLINPVHSLAAGFWIGTLFVMVIAGIVPVLRDPRVREHRGPIVANMVHGFSPLALTMGMIVVIFGVITAWKHLTPFSSLWTTPYGYALLAKLVFVALVFGVGAWNWQRQRPTLGSDASAISIRRSSTAELSAAAIVLIITSILISLPSPRLPKPATGTVGGPTAASPAP